MIYKTAYFSCKAQLVANENSSAESLQISQLNILNKIAVWISEGSGWMDYSIN